MPPLARGFFCLLAATCCAQERYVPEPGQKQGFVVGLSDYGQEKRNLPNVARDVSILATGLQKLKFEVKASPARQNMTELVNSLGTWLEQRKESDFIFLYFSGHGFQSNANLYLAPSTFDPNNVSTFTLDQNALSAEQVLTWLRNPRVKYRQALVIFDICQTDFVKGEAGVPWKPNLGDHVQKIAVFLPSQGGKATTDNPSQNHGVLAQPLVDQLSKEGIMLDNALDAVKLHITRTTSQVPDKIYELSPPVFLNGAPKAGACTIDAVRNSGISEIGELRRKMPQCFSEATPKPEEGIKFISGAPEMPWGFTKDGRVGLNSLAQLKELAGWSNTTGVAREWWEAFEAQNLENQGTVAYLLGTLTLRKASITEFFLAYIYSDVDTVDENLAYLDEKRAEKAAEEGKLYLPPDKPAVDFVTATNSSGLPLSGRFLGPWDGEVLLGHEVPWGGPEAVLRRWWERAKADLTTEQRNWLLFESRALGLSIAHLREASPKNPLIPSRDLLEAASKVKSAADPFEKRLDEMGLMCRYCDHPSSAQDLEAALREVNDRLAFAADSGRLYVTRGLLLTNLGRDQLGYLSYREGLAQGFENGSVHNTMAAYLLRIGDYREAMNHYKKAHEIQIKQIESFESTRKVSDYVGAVETLTLYLLNAAEVSLHDENYMDANKFLDEALTAHKSMVARLVEWNIGENDLAEVKRKFEQWLTGNAIVRSAILAAQGKKKEAEDVFTKANLDVTTITSYEYRCWANAMLGDPEAGLSDCGRVIAQQPFNTVDGHAYKAMALFRLKRYPEALGSIDEALQRIPESGAYYFERALILAGLKRMGDAYADLERSRWLGYKVPNLKWVNQALQEVPQFSLWNSPPQTAALEVPLREVFNGNAAGETWARKRVKSLLGKDPHDPQPDETDADHPLKRELTDAPKWVEKSKEIQNGAVSPEGLFQLLIYWEIGATLSKGRSTTERRKADYEALSILKQRAKELAQLDKTKIRAYTRRLAMRFSNRAEPDVDAAQESFKAGLAQFYADATTPLARCDLALHTIAINEAVAACVAAAEANPQDLDVARNLGHAYLLAGRHQQALVQYGFRPANLSDENWKPGEILRGLRELLTLGPKIPNYTETEEEIRKVTESPAGRRKLEQEKAALGWGSAAKLTQEWWLAIEKRYFDRLPDLALAAHHLISQRKSMDEAYLGFLGKGEDPVTMWEIFTRKPDPKQPDPKKVSGF